MQILCFIQHVDVYICFTCMCMSIYAALCTVMIMTTIDIYLIYDRYIIILFLQTECLCDLTHPTVISVYQVTRLS